MVFGENAFGKGKKIVPDRRANPPAGEIVLFFIVIVVKSYCVMNVVCPMLLALENVPNVLSYTECNFIWPFNAINSIRRTRPAPSPCVLGVSTYSFSGRGKCVGRIAFMVFKEQARKVLSPGA